MASKCSETTEAISEQPIQRFRNVIKNSCEYVFTWLDKNSMSSEENLDMQAKMRKIVGDLKIFEDPDACVEYITDLKDQKVVLIVCGSYNHRLISVIHHLSHLSAIYVYCFEKETVEEWSKYYEKIKGVFTQTKDLVISVCRDQGVREVSSIKCFDKHQVKVEDGFERIAADSMIMNVYSTQDTDVSEERDLKNTNFMYFQVLINILLNITSKQNSSAKQDLLDHFKHIYEGSATEERLIQEIENNYKPEDAIRWYTRPTFLYVTLNKALRDCDFDVLFALRFFISDLQQQLTIAHEAFLTSHELENPVIRVYRGQNICVTDLNFLRQNIGQFVAIQSFLSTSIDKTVANFFSSSGAPTTADTACILFEFHLDTRISNTKPYSYIKHLSHCRDEEEVLIMLGSIFRIEQIEYNDQDKTWIGILSLCSEDNYELQELMKHLKEETGDGIASPGNLLHRQGDNEKARLYFQQVLLDQSLDDLDRARCYRGLAMVATTYKKYDEAIENFQNQLELLTKYEEPEEIGTAYTFMGEVYLFKNELDKALSYEQKALDILLPLNAPQLSNVYAIMGTIYMQNKDFSQALEYQEKGLAIDRQSRPENHQIFGITYANMGATYHLSGDYIKALEYYKKARKVYSKTIAPNHPGVLSVEENIRRVERLINK